MVARPEYLAVRQREGELQVLINPLRRPTGQTISLQQHRGELIWCDDSSRPHPGDWVEVGQLDELPEPWGAMLCEILAMFWPLFSLSHPLLSAEYSIIHPELARAPELTFYGGSFDPLHPGHLSCMELCPARPLIVVPDHNPQKLWREDRPFWQIYRRLVKATQGMGGVYVYPGFCGRPAPNPTIDWFRQLEMKRNLLMGEDCLMGLLQWRDIGQLLPMVHQLYVAPRTPGVEGDTAAQVQRLRAINSQLRVQWLPRHPHESLSSSDIRD